MASNLQDEATHQTITPRDEHGRILAPLPGGAPPITSANARTMAEKRWAKARAAAAAAVVDEAKSIFPNVTSPAAAWGVMNARLFSQIMDSDKPRENAVTALGRNIGALPADWEIQAQSSERADNNYLRDVLADLADIARAIRVPLHDTIDADVESSE
jgi:hypothetical protein